MRKEGSRLALIVLATILLLPVITSAECRLVWDPSASPEVEKYLVYVSPVKASVEGRTVVPAEVIVTEVLCTTVSVDLNDYAGVSAWGMDNESELSNIVQRKDLVKPGPAKVQHFIIVTE